MKKLLMILGIITVVIVGGYLYLLWSGGIAGGGGSEHIVPDSAKNGEPIVIGLRVNTWGAGGKIEGRYTNISLAYRLVGENEYQLLQPRPGILPSNYTNPDLPKTLQYEAYEFIIPPYPKGTIGEIEYYIDMTFDGYPSHTEGIKKIRLTDE
jgi:hypothetical protein